MAVDQLVASVARALAAQPPLTGRVAAHVDLGVPELVDSQLGAAAGTINSFWGDHRLRVWWSPDGLKVADLLPGAERSLVASSAGGWLWDSTSFTAYRVIATPPARSGSKPGSGSRPGSTLVPGSGSKPGSGSRPGSTLIPGPGSGGDSAPDGGLPAAGTPDPLTLARLSLAHLEPTTRVSASPGRTVAGRPAYLITLEPLSAGTLVGRVEVSVDAEHRVPLRVAVFARGASSPALSAAFVSVGFERPPAATFRFSPPPGATVRNLRLGASAPTGERREDGEDLDEYVRTFGAGWETVAAVRVPPRGSPAGRDGAIPAGLAQLLPFSGPLLSARLAERPGATWLLVGMVPQSRLAALAGSAALP